MFRTWLLAALGYLQMSRNYLTHSLMDQLSLVKKPTRIYP